MLQEVFWFEIVRNHFLWIKAYSTFLMGMRRTSYCIWPLRDIDDFLEFTAVVFHTRTNHADRVTLPVKASAFICSVFSWGRTDERDDGDASVAATRCHWTHILTRCFSLPLVLQPVADAHHWYYILEMSFYLSLLLCVSVDVKRKVSASLIFKDVKINPPFPLHFLSLCVWHLNF